MAQRDSFAICQQFVESMKEKGANEMRHGSNVRSIRDDLRFYARVSARGKGVEWKFSIVIRC